MKKFITLFIIVALLSTTLVNVSYARYVPDDILFHIDAEVLNEGNIFTGQEVQVKYDIEPYPVYAGNPKPKEVIIIMDKSSSMSYNIDGQTRLSIARKSALEFIDQLSEGNNVKVGVINYAKTAHEFTMGGKFFFDISDSSEKSLANRGISVNIADENGNYAPTAPGTNIGDALRKAYHIFDNRVTEAQKYIVLLTDGDPHQASVNFWSESVADYQKDLTFKEWNEYKKINAISDPNISSINNWLAWKNYYNNLNRYKKVGDKELALTNLNKKLKYEYLMDEGDATDTVSIENELAGEFPGVSCNEYTDIWVDNIKDSDITPYYIGFATSESTRLIFSLNKAYGHIATEQSNPNRKFFNAKNSEQLNEVYGQIAENTLSDCRIDDLAYELITPDELKIKNEDGQLVNKTSIPLSDKIHYTLSSNGRFYLADPFSFVVTLVPTQAGRYEVGYDETEATLNYTLPDKSKKQKQEVAEVYLKVRKINEPTIVMTQMSTPDPKSFYVEDNGTSSIVFSKEDSVVEGNVALANALYDDSFAMRFKLNPYKLTSKKSNNGTPNMFYYTDGLELGINKAGSIVALVDDGTKKSVLVFGDGVNGVNEGVLNDVIVSVNNGVFTVSINGYDYEQAVLAGKTIKASTYMSFGGYQEINTFYGIINDMQFINTAIKNEEVDSLDGKLIARYNADNSEFSYQYGWLSSYTLKDGVGNYDCKISSTIVALNNVPFDKEFSYKIDEEAYTAYTGGKIPVINEVGKKVVTVKTTGSDGKVYSVVSKTANVSNPKLINKAVLTADKEMISKDDKVKITCALSGDEIDMGVSSGSVVYRNLIVVIKTPANVKAVDLPHGATYSNTNNEITLNLHKGVLVNTTGSKYKFPGKEFSFNIEYKDKTKTGDVLFNANSVGLSYGIRNNMTERYYLGNALLIKYGFGKPIIYPISDDDIVNENELAGVTISGKSIPNKNVKLEITSNTSPQVITANVMAGPNGEFTVTKDIRSLGGNSFEVKATVQPDIGEALWSTRNFNLKKVNKLDFDIL